ncbi:hypothetical protein BS78_07G106300 [Paspalum vaginatum]|nr:hypothetical protein BS78_07G106300 [Paspalum vaginatum]
MAGLSTGAGPPVINVYHEKSMILPDVSRVLACLYEKNVKFETIKASYKDILSLQASRSVPVPFYDGPVFLQDSRAICRYIAENYELQGYPFLLGKDVLERASIEQWLRNEEHAFDPPSRALFCHLAFPLEDDDDDDYNEDREKRKLEEVLEVYEQRLSETEFLAGNKFTLADLVHLPGTHHIITSERFAYLYDSRKNVQRWWSKISTRDSWQQVLKDMKTVEDHRKEELEKQQQQWQREYLQPFGGHEIQISHRQQEGTKSQTVLVPPPSTGTIIASIPPAPQEHETTYDHKPSSPIQRNQGGFFTPTEKTRQATRQTDSTTQKPPSSGQNTKSSFFLPSTPTNAKTDQRTDAEMPSQKGASSPSKISQRPSNEAPDKPHVSDFFKTKDHKDEAGYLAKSSPQPSSKIPRASQTSEAVTPDKTSLGSAKVPPRIDGPDAPYAPEAGEKQKSAMDTTYPQGEIARKSTYTSAPADTKRAKETDQDRPPSHPAQKVPSGVQDAQKQAKAMPTELIVPGSSPQRVGSEEDAQDGIDGDERFSTKRLLRMLNPDAPGSQDSDMEEAPVIPKKPSDVHDREKQTTAVPANKMTSSPSIGTRVPYTPDTTDERVAISPPKGVRPENPQPIQPVPPTAPSTDKLDKTEGVDMRAPQRARDLTPTDAKSTSSLVQGADPRARAISDEQTDKSYNMGGRAPEELKRKTSDSQGTSASVQEAIIDARVKQASAGQEEISGVQDTGDRDTNKKSIVGKTAAEHTSGSQQTTGPAKGVGPTSPGTLGDKSTRGAMADPSAALPGPVRAPASGGQNASAVPSGGNLDNGKNEAAKSSPDDPRSMRPAIPGKLGASPDTQIRTTPGQLSKPSPPVSSLSDARNEKTSIVENSQTSLLSSSEQPGGQAPGSARGPSSVPPSVDSPEGNNKTYKKEASEQQLPRDQYRAQLAENKKQGDDAAPVTRIGKSKEGAPSNLQVQSDQNKPQASNDGGKQTKETENPPGFATPKEVWPSPPEKSKQQQQLLGDKSGIALQDNVKQSSEAAPQGSVAEQQRKKDFATNVNKNNEKTSLVNSEEKSPTDTQQVKSNRSDGTSDSSSKPTQLEGNKGNLPESERRGS